MEKFMGVAKSVLGIGEKPRVAVKSFYDLSAKTAEDGTLINFADFRGKAVLVSNVASKCGLTASMYKAFGELASKYGKNGEFVVLGFPCGQFLGQEFDKAEETCPFVEQTLSEYNVMGKSFLLMEKIDVNGENTHPVFQFLKYNSPLYDEKKGNVSPISWNFGKFLVDKEGKVVKFYAPTDAKLDDDVQAVINGSLTGHNARPPTQQ